MSDPFDDLYNDAPAVGAKGEIVVVDDSRMNTQIIEAMLQAIPDMGCRTFTEPKPALTYILKNKPLMVLTDHEMPNLKGLDLIREVRKSFDKYEIPIIMITSSESKALFKEGFEVGLTDFIGKPIEQIQLLARVRSHLEAADTIKKYRAKYGPL